MQQERAVVCALCCLHQEHCLQKRSREYKQTYQRARTRECIFIRAPLKECPRVKVAKAVEGIRTVPRRCVDVGQTRPINTSQYTPLPRMSRLSQST